MVGRLFFSFGVKYCKIVCEEWNEITAILQIAIVYVCKVHYWYCEDLRLYMSMKIKLMSINFFQNYENHYSIFRNNLWSFFNLMCNEFRSSVLYHGNTRPGKSYHCTNLNLDLFLSLWRRNCTFVDSSSTLAIPNKYG